MQERYQSIRKKTFLDLRRNVILREKMAFMGNQKNEKKKKAESISEYVHFLWAEKVLEIDSNQFSAAIFAAESVPLWLL